MIIICIVVLNVLYDLNIWVTPPTYSLGLRLTTSVLRSYKTAPCCLHEPPGDDSPPVDALCIFTTLWESGIILYVPQPMVWTTAKSMAAIGFVLGKYFGWRELTVPYGCGA
jgi:hypothetical protein